MLPPWDKKRLKPFVHFSVHNLQNVQPSGDLTSEVSALLCAACFCVKQDFMFADRLWKNICDWSCAMSGKWSLSAKVGGS